MAKMRTPDHKKHSTFYHRDTSGKLVVSTYWNSDAAPNYYEQPWHEAGQNAPKGQCAWPAAYQDAASPQPRTNCAMGIYKDGALFGMSTIDVTLGVFNILIQDKQKEVQGQIMIVERDGRILTNQETIPGKIVLKNIADFSNQSLFAKQIQKACAASPAATFISRHIKTCSRRPDVFPQSRTRHALVDCDRPAHFVADLAQQ